MKKTTSITAMIGGLALYGAPTAHAQAPPPPPESTLFASVSVGGQPLTRTFTANETIHVFDEDGVVTANQTVGGGLVFDMSGANRVWHNVAIAVGLSTFHGKGTAAAVAAIPDQLRRNAFRTQAFSVANLGQTDVALNLQIVYMRPITDRIDLAVFLGPSLIHVKQALASVTVDTSTQVATPSIDTQSKTTAKAGSAGVDLSYKLTDRYSAGLFLRYLGGQVNLPAAPKLKVGGVQLGLSFRAGF